MYSVDEDDEGVDQTMIEKWFIKVVIPIEEAEQEELAGGKK